jgi:hypothetical protein
VKRIAFLLLPLIWACGDSQVAGSGSQTGNSIVAGRILAGDSARGAMGVIVYLRPLSWTSGQPAAEGALDSTWTDSEGMYRFAGVPHDTYKIEARLSDSGWSRTVRANSNDNRVSEGALHLLGSLDVEVDLTDSLQGGRLEIYGLDRAMVIPTGAPADSEIHVVFDRLPLGLQTVRIWTRNRDFADTAVRIQPGAITHLDFDNLNGVPEGPHEDP